MTENKLQCYVKSVKKDTDSILTTLKPAIIEFLKMLLPAIGVLLAAIIIFTLMIYGEPYITAVFTVIGNIFTMVISQPFLTQYNTYMAILIIIDLVIFMCVKKTMTDQNGYLDDRSPVSQVGHITGLLFLLFAFNAMLVVATWGSQTPERFIGWSFMIGETVVNMVISVIGILLIRAYLKCENKIVPLSPGNNLGNV